ncbi:MAG: alanine--glyoxylate aminotransferase family protein [Nitrospira sp.]|nr:alanine--glyoxylate aminotransferase family protein [Nitrospira sp.]MBP0121638.1 alanine--glyoxylate aminotransferase family protein [Nitrospira sp.]MBP0123720.1 alanine--glyoxylate aminotransferase family protein [Nitrospira sp.]MBP0126667.1 alanine--glyoxylate aminotransferase family protein [Nitrospira sp.]MBP0131293.1 alanine--glyoxylate aminotransferase family protein [Nitrospira sp.]
MPVQSFTPLRRLLLGPGPSMVHPRVLRALSMPLIGHLDQAFLGVMNDIQTLLRGVFETNNRFTIAVSGTGSAGMEASIVNIVEPSDAVIVGVNGVFGTRWASAVERCGGKAIRVEAPWGQVIDPAAIEQALIRSGPVKAVAIVQAETSTGAWQPLEPIATLCRKHDALFLVDAVTSLGGIPVEVDRWGIDVCYSGTQKCLSCPPGLSPFTLSDRALTAIKARRSPCQSWYFDMTLIEDYWAEGTRAYHHTAPISMLYALREALRLVEEEGLPARFARHQLNSEALLAGLAQLGLLPLPQAGHRLPMLTCVTVPSHIPEAEIRMNLLSTYGIEIGGGLGPLKGKVWRIGLMGESSTEAHVLTLLNALEELFTRQGWLSTPGVALQAAARIYSRMAS